MKDANKVFICGKAKPGRCTIRDNFAYVNLEMNGIPVVISYGGSKYNKSQVPDLSSYKELDVIVGGDAYIDSNKGKWEVKVRNTDFAIINEAEPMAFAQIRGKVMRAENDSNGMLWAEVGSSYFSKNPSTGEGTWKDRLIRINIGTSLEASLIDGKRISVVGSLGANPLHVIASNCSLI